WPCGRFDGCGCGSDIARSYRATGPPVGGATTASGTGDQQRHHDLRRGQRAVAALQLERPGVVGVLERDRLPGDERDVTEARQRSRQDLRAEPALVEHLAAAPDP